MTDRYLELLERAVVALEVIAGNQRKDGLIDCPDLVEALADYFGSGTFTSTTVLMAADEPGSEVGAVLSRLIDFERPSPIVGGRLLSRLSGVERVGDRRGARLVRLRAGSSGL